MDPSFKLRKLFLKTATAFKKIKTQNNIKKQRKIILIKEIDNDLFFMKESAKKMLKEKKINVAEHKKINEKIQKIKKELSLRKKELTNPLA